MSRDKALADCAWRRAIQFLPDNATEAQVERLTALLVQFVHEALVGDISDGTYVHWLREEPRVGMRRFALVACGRTFNITTRAGSFQAITNLAYITCPKCRAIAALESAEEERRA